MENPAITDRVKELILRTGSSNSEVISNCKLPNKTFYRYMNYDADWQLQHIISVAKFFKKKIEWLITGEGEESTDSLLKDMESEYIHTKNTPIYGYVHCGKAAPQWPDEAVLDRVMTDYKYQDVFGVYASGDSMSPYINHKDILICVDAPEKIKNKTAVVVVFKTIDTVEANAKLITFDKKKKSVILYSINTKYEPEVFSLSDILKIYKVVEIRRKVK